MTKLDRSLFLIKHPLLGLLCDKDIADVFSYRDRIVSVERGTNDSIAVLFLDNNPYLPNADIYEIRKECLAIESV